MKDALKDKILRRAILDALYAFAPRMLEADGASETLRWMGHAGYSAEFMFLVRERFGQISQYQLSKEVPAVVRVMRLMAATGCPPKKRSAWPVTELNEGH